jgi:hypothetical protein
MRWILSAVCLLGTALASADHGAPPPPRGGLGWLSWLLIAGAVVAVSLAAWAFFAPDRPEGETGSARQGSRESSGR